MNDKTSVWSAALCLLAAFSVLSGDATAQFRGRGGMRFYRPSPSPGGFGGLGGLGGFGGARLDGSRAVPDDRLDARDDALASRDDRFDAGDDARAARDDARDVRIDSGRYVRPLPYVPIGRHVSLLPAGHRAMLVGGRRYYYYGGAFYLPGSDGYDTVAAPIGATVAALPAGYTQIVVDGQVYYFYQGVFWQLDASTGLYVVVAAPAGAIVPTLPTGYTTTYVGGTRYYAYGGVNYSAYWVNGGRRFKVLRA